MLLGNKSYLKSPPVLCLNTHLCLSLVLLLLKPNKTLQHAVVSLSTASVKSLSTLSCLSKPNANFHSLQSCPLVSNFCLSFSEAFLHSFPAVYSDRSKKQVTAVLFLYFPNTYITVLTY